MGVDVRCGAEIRVTEPFLNLFQRNAVRQQERRAGVTEVMEAHTAQSVFLAEIGKFRSEVVRLHAVAHFIDKDITVILVIVAVAANRLVVLLRLLNLHEIVLEGTDQRQRPHTGFRFGCVLCPVHESAVQLHCRDRVGDGNGSALKINRVPFQSDHFPAAESVKGGDHHRQFQLAPFQISKQRFHFFRREKDRLEAVHGHASYKKLS